MESQKSQEDPRKKTLEATAAPPKNPHPLSERPVNPHPPTASSSLNPAGQVNAGESQNEGEGEQKVTKAPAAGSAAASGSTSSIATASGLVTDLQKKRRRAERFGMPVQLSEEEKRNSRAERFGTGPTSHGAKNAGKPEEQRRKARAERFGLAGHSTADEEAKKKARSERFAQNPKPDTREDEKRTARAIRFSLTSSSSSEANGKANSELVWQKWIDTADGAVTDRSSHMGSIARYEKGRLLLLRLRDF